MGWPVALMILIFRGGRDQAAALGAVKEAGVDILVVRLLWLGGATEERLDAFELFERHHRLVRALVELAVVAKPTRIERIGK